MTCWNEGRIFMIKFKEKNIDELHNIITPPEETLKAINGGCTFYKCYVSCTKHKSIQPCANYYNSWKYCMNITGNFKKRTCPGKTKCIKFNW